MTKTILEQFREEFGDISFVYLGLSEKELVIMELRTKKQKTLEEVGKEYGVTRERIRQIEAKANEKLRQKQKIEHFLTTIKEQMLECVG